LLDLDLSSAISDFRRLTSGVHGERAPRLIVRSGANRIGAPSRYNEVVLGEGGRVLSFREKPSQATSELAAIALYLFPQHVAARVAEYLSGGGNPDAPGHFIQWLVEQEPVYASPLLGSWFDIGTPETLAAARRAYAARTPAA
jgi:NDP-sugar pyrophosphorylase family protein